MNKDTMKAIFLLKLKVVDCLANQLPEPQKEKLHHLQNDLLSAIGEAAWEFLDYQPPEGKTTTVKSVHVE